MEGKILVFSAPSGSGKTTIVRAVMQQIGNIFFSVSATSRSPRGTEQDGVDYYFISPQEFRNRIENGDFIEYQEVYKDKYYGTLKSEIEKKLVSGKNIVLDIDVEGAMNVKRIYGGQALLIFVQPPSIEELRKRLEGRATDTQKVIENRMAKASYELTFADKFDKVVVNDKLDVAINEVCNIVKDFIS